MRTNKWKAKSMSHREGLTTAKFVYVHWRRYWVSPRDERAGKGHAERECTAHRRRRHWNAPEEGQEYNLPLYIFMQCNTRPERTQRPLRREVPRGNVYIHGRITGRRPRGPSFEAFREISDTWQIAKWVLQE